MFATPKRIEITIYTKNTTATKKPAKKSAATKKRTTKDLKDIMVEMSDP